MKTDYETVAVPAVYKAVTGYDYEDLNDATQTQQSMESLVGFMKEDTNERIQSIQGKPLQGTEHLRSRGAPGGTPSPRRATPESLSRRSPHSAQQ